MPQIANQDYNVIRPVYADALTNDAEALGRLAGHLKRGTILDCVICTIVDGDEFTSRVFACDSQNGIYFYDAYNGEITNVIIAYSPEQYSGLAVVQKACELKDAFPVFSGDMDYFLEDNTGNYIAVDGFLCKITRGGGKITSISVSNVLAETFGDVKYINIPFEDAQKLVGVNIV